MKARSVQAIAGATQLQSQRADRKSSSPDKGRRRRLSPFDGRRGCQESNWFSFISFIDGSFQFGFDFLKPVAVTARRSVGRNVQQAANFFKGAAMPDL